MIYVKLQLMEEYYKAVLIHYQPFHPRLGLKKTREVLMKDGVFVDALPESPIYQEHFINELRADINTKELYYESVYVG